MPFSIVSPTVEQETFHWNGLRRSDLSEIHDLLQTVNRVDDNAYAESLDDLVNQYEDPWSNPRTDARVIRDWTGKLVAFLRVFVNPKPEDENVAFLLGEVDPNARGQGLEQEALDWMEDRARERLAETLCGEDRQAVPSVIRVDCPESATARIALYRACGYKQVRSFFKMERDLDAPIPENPLPPGLVLRTYGEELDEALRQAFNEAFRDHWGHQEVSRQEWQPFVMGRSDVRHDLTLVVMEGAQVAAFTINRVRTSENERLGIRRGWIGTLGTRRAWRKRGLASALLAESMRRFRAEGFDSVGLGVDAKNLTGALALYERIGFKAYKTGVVLEKRV